MMAKELLDQIIDGSISFASIIESIKTDQLDFTVFREQGLKDEVRINLIEDFVPFFLYYIKTNLSSYLSPQQAVQCSPKRRPDSKKHKGKNGRKGKTSKTSLLTKYTAGPVNSTLQHSEKSIIQNEGPSVISLDKNLSKSSSANQSINSGSEAELTGNRTFPITKHVPRHTGRSPKVGNTTVKESKTQFQKRRIAPTLITPEKVSLHEDEGTKALFVNSPVLEASESSLDSDSSSAVGCSNEKLNKLEKKMRKGRKGPTMKLPLAAFLTNDNDFNTPNDQRFNSTPLKPLTPDVQKVYQQRLVSSPIEANNEPSSSEKSINFEMQSNLQQSTRSLEDSVICLDMVKCKDKLMICVDLYECILLENLVSNITLELYFLFSVLNSKLEMQPASRINEVFSCVENCVFFAAKTLERVKKLFTILDTGCLKLITENQRLHLFEPDVISFAKECLKDVVNNNCAPIVVSGTSNSLGVPFQVELNNRKSFSSDRYFYSFSKLRDKFYGLIRIWEENHLNEDWSIDEELGIEFFNFFHGHEEFPTYAQFSQLFISQLIEMCGQDFSSTLNKDGNISSNFLSYLRNADPGKLQLLQERFKMPAVSHDPCPRPYFTDVENFFKVFIRHADSYQLNIHLTDAMLSRLLEINSIKIHTDYEQDGDDSDILALTRQEFSKNLSEARILAKFLGFIVFLPYVTDSKSRKINSDSVNKELIKQPFNPEECLEEALCTEQQLLTVPWVVLYLSMMDTASLRINVNKKAFLVLAALYREKSLRLWQQGLCLNKLFILIQLGWLFEQPNIAAEMPFHHLIAFNNTESTDKKPDWILNLVKCPLMNKSLLIRFCPFVSEIKMALSNRGARAQKKITPFTQREAPAVAEEKQLRDKLIENFLKYQPKYVKDSVNFLVERFSSNLKHQATMILIPEKIKSITEYLEKETNFKKEGRLEIDEMKSDCNAQCLEQMAKSKAELTDDVSKLALEYCNEKSNKAVSAIFPVGLHERVVNTAAKIVTHQVKCNISDWIHNKFLDLFETDLDLAVNRFLMNILKTHNKSLTSV